MAYRSDPYTLSAICANVRTLTIGRAIFVNSMDIAFSILAHLFSALVIFVVVVVALVMPHFIAQKLQIISLDTKVAAIP